MSNYVHTLAHAWRDVVAEHAARPALQFTPQLAVTYADLDGLSNRVARFLDARGVARGDCIGICLEKNLNPYVVILAAIRRGIAYFAMDPRNPVARLQQIVAQCRPALVFADRHLDVPGLESRQVLCEESFTDVPFARAYDPAPLPDVAGTGADPAYIMFTSGSTGVPKGAVISHSNLLYFIQWARWQYAFTPADVHTHLNPLYFDNSVFDMYSTFFSGGSLVPFDAKILMDPAGIVNRIAATGCTTFFSVPSLLMYLQAMKVLRPEPLASLQRIIFGGEGYPKVRLRELRQVIDPRTALINVYGPTECTCICSSMVVAPADIADDNGYPPLGQLIPNFQGYILDGDQAVPPGDVGELCLGGPCVGHGYFNQPEQSARAFVQNPLNADFQERLYRTGDLVREDPADGRLYFVGRKDLQIKHQGYRIELEEIQHALAALPGVDEAIALHYKDAQGSRLLAVVAAAAGADGADLKRQAGARLPHYMVPERIHVVPALPKNANGKTDRQRLTRDYAPTPL